MTALVMDGLLLRTEITAAIRAAIDGGRTAPCLATVVVGDNPRCHVFARDKRSAAAEAGLRTVAVDLTGAATQDQVDDAIARLADDPGVHGIFVQLPVPGHIQIRDLVPPAKDVDGARPDSLHAPTTPLAVALLLERFGIPIDGRRVVVVGTCGSRGMEAVLAGRGADVTVIDEASPDACREAEVLVATAGRPCSIGADHVRPGAAVVDVAGDVDTGPVQAVAAAIAPYPAAVGPVAVACLLRNTADAAKLGR